MALQDATLGPRHYLQGVFNDVGEVGRSLGFDMGFRQINPGLQSIRATSLVSDSLAVLKMQFNRGYHQRASHPSGTITFGVPEVGVEDWFGAPYPGQSILPFNQASGIDLVSHSGFRAYTISFSEEFLQQVSTIFQIPVAESLHKPSSGALIPDSPAVQNLRTLIRALSSDHPPGLVSEQETALAVELLHAGLGEAATIDTSTPAARSRAVSQALNYIAAHDEDVVTVGEICAATGIAWRTLSRAFKERFGMGPKAYLNCARLSAVRNQLSTCGEDTLIADVANDQGFWHLGQFAHDYRNLYGELPSETLHRAPSSRPTIVITESTL